MKTILIAFGFTFLASGWALAQESGILGSLKGDVVIERGTQRIVAKEKTEVHAGDRIKGEVGSSVRIQFGDRVIFLRGKFVYIIPKAAEGQPQATHELLEGQARVKTLAKFPEGRPLLKNPGSVAGVRGTDFWMSYFPALGESEVLCFEHAIQFTSLTSKSTVEVKQGQWGGVGGRFGKTIQPPIDVPPKFLEDLKNQFSLN